MILGKSVNVQEIDHSRTDRPNELNNANDLKFPKSIFFIIGNEFCER
jgi:hypothetical protein